MKIQYIQFECTLLMVKIQYIQFLYRYIRDVIEVMLAEQKHYIVPGGTVYFKTYALIPEYDDAL